MKGRGYVDNGDRNAANYLASELKKLIKKIFQKLLSDFTTTVNSFPGKMSLCIMEIN
jgi:hypothetical protein